MLVSNVSDLPPPFSLDNSYLERGTIILNTYNYIVRVHTPSMGYRVSELVCVTHTQVTVLIQHVYICSKTTTIYTTDVLTLYAIYVCTRCMQTSGTNHHKANENY